MLTNPLERSIIVKVEIAMGRVYGRNNIPMTPHVEKALANAAFNAVVEELSKLGLSEVPVYSVEVK